MSLGSIKTFGHGPLQGPDYSLWFLVSVELEVDESWYPKQKIEVARRKLNGDNCAHIMR